MTTQQELEKPVVTQLKANGLAKPMVATAEFLRLAAIEPKLTVWGDEEGRPIYDRLPSIEQAYVRGYEKGQAYVYLDEVTGKAFGPGSLSVGALSDSRSTLAVENGKITWSEGTISVDAYQVDLQRLNFDRGLPDGEYQVGYELTYEPFSSDSLIPGYGQADLDNDPLFDSAVITAASSFAPGHEPFHAISELGAWWPNSARTAGAYDPGSWLVLDFQEPGVASAFTVVADPTVEEPTASLAVYYSDDAIIWYAVDTQISPQDGKWEVTTNETEAHRYWRFFFWDGTASVSELLYSGQAYVQDFTSTGPVTNATPYLDGIYETPPGDYILLATFTIIEGNIGQVADMRNIVTQPYEPVASWLTDFQDQNLRCLFDDVTKYSGKFLAPPTADYHFYDELDDSVCSGPGQFELGIDFRGVIEFPAIVEITCTSVGTTQIDYLIEATPQNRDIATDPNEVDIMTDGLFAANPACLVTPDQVILLKDPAFPSDMATVAYTQFELTSTWSLDNGFY